MIALENSLSFFFSLAFYFLIVYFLLNISSSFACTNSKIMSLHHSVGLLLFKYAAAFLYFADSYYIYSSYLIIFYFLLFNCKIFSHLKYFQLFFFNFFFTLLVQINIKEMIHVEWESAFV